MTVWDCFLYNGEQEALAQRLALHNVDKRIVVEASMTHSGRVKDKLYYNWSLPGVRLIVPDLRPYTSPWARENAQRNAITQGLTDAGDTDVVLISDADEIPSADGIERGQEGLRSSPAVVLCQVLYNYNRKWQDPRGWRGTIMTTAGHLKHTSPQQLRDARETLPRVENAGEHLSWWGGVEEVSRKLASFAHSEYSHVGADQESIRRRIESGEDLFGRWQLQQASTG